MCYNRWWVTTYLHINIDMYVHINICFRNRVHSIGLKFQYVEQIKIRVLFFLSEESLPYFIFSKLLKDNILSIICKYERNFFLCKVALQLLISSAHYEIVRIVRKIFTENKLILHILMKIEIMMPVKWKLTIIQICLQNLSYNTSAIIYICWFRN